MFAVYFADGRATLKAQLNYEPYTFKTLAGAPPANIDGIGSAARFNGPGGVAVDSVGNIYVADTYNNTIRKMTPGGVVSTFAGLAHVRGFADGQCSNARFYYPIAIALDRQDNLYVADWLNHTIRKITRSGVVSTFAGQAGIAGSSDGTGTAAQFDAPVAVAVDKAGNIYVADSGNYTIRKISPLGVVSTLAGAPGTSGSADGPGDAARFNIPRGVTVDETGNVFVFDSDNFTIRKITPSGVVSTFAGVAGSVGTQDGTGDEARFSQGSGVAVDRAGNIYVSDTAASTVRKITPARQVTTFAGLAITPGTVDGTGNAARFDRPAGIAVDAAGNVFLVDSDTIRKITPARVVTTLAGLASGGSSDGKGAAARFYQPSGVAVDTAGNVYVGDTFNSTIRKISPTGVVSTLAGLAGVTPGGTSVDGTGSSARFIFPLGVAVDKAGNVYVADDPYTIRKITPSGEVTTLAGLDQNTGSADGIGSTARFNRPKAVAVDDAGNVFVADSENHTIRKITASGVVTTFAGLAGNSGSADGTGSEARFSLPSGIAVDSANNVYVADAGNNTIRRITPSRVVTTFAGLPGAFGNADGTGSSARFAFPEGVAVDGDGTVYVADSSNATIRKITPARVVTTLAGTTATNFGIADGTGPAAQFGRPTGIAVDKSGQVYVADSPNNTIRIGNLLPVITSPLGAIAVKNEKFVYQFETIQATSLAASNLPAGLTFDPARSAIVGNATTIGVFPVTLSASNTAGTTTATLTIVVQDKAPSVPVIISSTSVTGRTQEPFKFQVITTGTTPAAQLTATDCPCGLSADPIAGTITGIPTADGSTKVNLTVTDVNATATGTVQLTFTSDPVRPVITSSDRANLVPGQEFNYEIVAPVSDPSDPPTFSILGTLPSGLNFDGNTGIISGVFAGSLAQKRAQPDSPQFTGGILGTIQLFSTNSHGTSTYQLLFLLKPTGAVNISTRTTVGSGDNVLIAGFIISGNATEAVIIRAIAPSLKINGALQDPILELHNEAGETIINDNWRDKQKALIVDSKVPPTDERESAIVAALDAGNYTAVVRGKDNTTGIAVVEVYDLGSAPLKEGTTAKLAQISTRGHITTGDDVLIGGFIVDVLATKVILRAIGPSLNGLVAGALQDTTLELHDGFGSIVASNDDWRTTQQQQIIDSTVPPKDDRESAIVATLNPGPYTAIVRGKDRATGVGLVEVYGLK